MSVLSGRPVAFTIIKRMKNYDSVRSVAGTWPEQINSCSKIGFIVSNVQMPLGGDGLNHLNFISVVEQVQSEGLL